MLYKIMQGLVEVPLPTSFQQATTRTCHGQYQSLVIWLDLDNIFSINNVYFDNMVSKIYSSELQLNKANTSDTEAAFLDLHLSISNDIVSTKIYDKRDSSNGCHYGDRAFFSLKRT